jgi:hypothetical protein
MNESGLAIRAQRYGVAICVNCRRGCSSEVRVFLLRMITWKCYRTVSSPKMLNSLLNSSGRIPLSSHLFYFCFPLSKKLWNRSCTNICQILHIRNFTDLTDNSNFKFSAHYINSEVWNWSLRNVHTEHVLKAATKQWVLYEYYFTSLYIALYNIAL